MVFSRKNLPLAALLPVRDLALVFSTNWKCAGPGEYTDPYEVLKQWGSNILSESSAGCLASAKTWGQARPLAALP